MRKIIILCLLTIVNSLNARYVYELSVGMMFRDEAPYLKEWIEFHRLVGVEHFYLVNNKSVDNYISVLKPYIRSGIITLLHENEDTAQGWSHIQINAYNKIIRRAKGETKWLALLDADEFLTPTQDASLCTILKEYEDFGGVYVFWQNFGTSHVQKIPDNKLLIEVLTMQADIHNFWNHWGKSIVRPERVKACDLHFHRYVEPFYHVDTNKQPLPDFASFEGKDLTVIPTFAIDISRMRINHYWTRHEEYFNDVKIARVKRWSASTPEIVEKANSFNHHQDTTIARFIEPLKARLGITT